MSSYNNIRKIKYTKTPADIVSLQEYIIFEAAHAQEKFVVFRFSNNVNQRLNAIKFEVLQYGKDNELLEKVVVAHKNFTAEPNDLFVPNAKLKINFGCESLEVRLEEAAFDRVTWEKGQFFDSSYTFDDYVSTLSSTQPVAVQAPKNSSKKKNKDKDKGKGKGKSKLKRNKEGFFIRNVTRKNKSVAPAVFNVLFCIVFTVFLIASIIYFNGVTNAYVVGDFIITGNSTGVTILGYNGKEANLQIPAVIEDREAEVKYYVTKIGSGAFSNSRVEGIELQTTQSLIIEANAFKNCSKLTSISSTPYCGDVVVLEEAFVNCKKLTTFSVSTARLSKKCFVNTSAIEVLRFYDVSFSDGRLLDIFKSVNEKSFKTLIFDRTKHSQEFFEGVSY